MVIYVIAAIIIFVISIIALVKFFQLCSDVRCIKLFLAGRDNTQIAEGPVANSYSAESISPTKSDVREFKDRIAAYKKEHKAVDEDWLENLVNEYNARFTEDFHQYL